MARLLPASFYRQDTVTVARQLLGQRLVHIVDGERLSGLIVETEAYLGATDRACHSFGHRRTQRTASMYLPGGHAYVYFIYGMHFCFNVVTRGTDEPEAVLIRAIEPDEGLESQRRRRRVKRDRDLTNGPGKLCQALAIDRSCGGLSLQGPELFIERVRTTPMCDADITARARIGVAYAGEDACLPLRFCVRHSSYLSKPI